jgi:hypothetical protein
MVDDLITAQKYQPADQQALPGRPDILLKSSGSNLCLFYRCGWRTKTFFK